MLTERVIAHRERERFLTQREIAHIEERVRMLTQRTEGGTGRGKVGTVGERAQGTSCMYDCILVCMKGERVGQ